MVAENLGFVVESGGESEQDGARCWVGEATPGHGRQQQGVVGVVQTFNARLCRVVEVDGHGAVHGHVQLVEVAVRMNAAVKGVPVGQPIGANRREGQAREVEPADGAPGVFVVGQDEAADVGEHGAD